MNANVRAGEKRLNVGGGGEWPISMKKHMQSRAERRRFASRSALLQTRPRTFRGLRPEVGANRHGFPTRISYESD